MLQHAQGRLVTHSGVMNRLRQLGFCIHDLCCVTNILPIQRQVCSWPYWNKVFYLFRKQSVLYQQHINILEGSSYCSTSLPRVMCAQQKQPIALKNPESLSLLRYIIKMQSLVYKFHIIYLHSCATAILCDQELQQKSAFQYLFSIQLPQTWCKNFTGKLVYFIFFLLFFVLCALFFCSKVRVRSVLGAICVYSVYLLFFFFFKANVLLNDFYSMQ